MKTAQTKDYPPRVETQTQSLFAEIQGKEQKYIQKRLRSKAETQ